MTSAGANFSGVDWPTAEGLFLDEGYGTTGLFWVAYEAGVTRVIYARGQLQIPLLPTIHGEAS